MNDEQSFEAMVRCMVEVSKEFYKDGLSPIVKPTGQALAVIPETVLTLLYPFRSLNLYAKYSLERTALLLSKKLENIPPENIVSPEPHIAVPALQQLSYSIDNENLREMYSNLLAKSMNRERQNEVHPSFVEIIKQLSPEEAVILKNIYTTCLNSPLEFVVLNISLFENKFENKKLINIDKIFDILYYSNNKLNCLDDRLNKILLLNNLIRLQLLSYGGIKVEGVVRMNQKKDIDDLFLTQSKEAIVNKNKIASLITYEADIHQTGYYPNEYGIQFAKVCVVE